MTRKLLLPLAASLPALLACSGIFSGDPKPGDDPEVEDALPVTDACLDYLDCLAQVDAATLASVLGTYGEGGTCWTTGEAAAETCDQACLSGWNSLGELYPAEEACVDEVQVCPLIDDRWELIIERTTDNCNAPWDLLTSRGELTCEDVAAGQVTANFPEIVPPMSCTLTGRDLDCFFQQGAVRFEVVATFDSALESASGGFLIDGNGCADEGTVELYRD